MFCSSFVENVKRHAKMRKNNWTNWRLGWLKAITFRKRLTWMLIVLARSVASEIGAKYCTEKDFQQETVIKAREMSTFNIKTSLCNTFFISICPWTRPMTGKTSPCCVLWKILIANDCKWLLKWVCLGQSDDKACLASDPKPYISLLTQHFRWKWKLQPPASHTHELRREEEEKFLFTNMNVFPKTSILFFHKLFPTSYRV